MNIISTVHGLVLLHDIFGLRVGPFILYYPKVVVYKRKVRYNTFLFPKIRFEEKPIKHVVRTSVETVAKFKLI